MSETKTEKSSSPTKKNKEVEAHKEEVANLTACLEEIATHMGQANYLVKYGLKRYKVTNDDMKRYK